MKPEGEEIVRRFLDGELSGEEERETLHRIADDPEGRALLRFDARLRGVLAEERRKRRSVPAGFTDRVMAAIEARERAAAAAGRHGPGGGRLARLWDELTRPRTLVWRPAWAAAAAAAVAVVAVVGLFAAGALPDPLARGGSGAAGEGAAARGVGGELAAGRTPSGTPAGPDSVLVRFVFTGGSAESVAVAGDFSRWEPIPLARRDSNGRSVWTGLVALPRGEHRYMFVLDGERWVTDPLATAVRDDGFGNRNAILSL